MANKIDRLLYCQSENSGAGIIILNDPLPIAGRVLLFKSYFELQTGLNERPPMAYSIVPGYNIVISFAGILGRGSRIDPSSLEYIQTVLNEMALWYYNFKISKHLPHWKRYLTSEN